MKYIVPLLTLTIASACNLQGDTNERSALLKKQMLTMSCDELSVELRYQEKILNGLQARNENQPTVLDVPATVLAGGYNLANNAYEKDERNERVDETASNIELVKSQQRERKCAL